MANEQNPITSDYVKLEPLEKILASIRNSIDKKMITNVTQEQVAFTVFDTNYVRNDIKAELEGTVKATLDSYDLIKGQVKNLMNVIPVGKNPDWHEDNIAELEFYWRNNVKIPQDRLAYMFKDLDANLNTKLSVVGNAYKHYNDYKTQYDACEGRLVGIYKNNDTNSPNKLPEHFLGFAYLPNNQVDYSPNIISSVASLGVFDVLGTTKVKQLLNAISVKTTISAISREAAEKCKHLITIIDNTKDFNVGDQATKKVYSENVKLLNENLGILCDTYNLSGLTVEQQNHVVALKTAMCLVASCAMSFFMPVETNPLTLRAINFGVGAIVELFGSEKNKIYSDGAGRNELERFKTWYFNEYLKGDGKINPEVEPSIKAELTYGYFSKIYPDASKYNEVIGSDNDNYIECNRSEAQGEKLSNILVGNDGNDVIIGSNFRDNIFGDSRFDPSQYRGNDTIEGRGGNDSLNGGYGNDTYYYSKNDGWDTIREYVKQKPQQKPEYKNPDDLYENTLFLYDRTAKDLNKIKFAKSEKGLLISFKDSPNDSVFVVGNTVKELKFSDNQIYQLRKLGNNIVEGTSNADNFYHNAELTGNTYIGGYGSDRYFIDDKNFGYLLIDETNKKSNDVDEVIFNATSLEDIRLYRQNDSDLLIGTVNGVISNTAEIKSYFKMNTISKFTCNNGVINNKYLKIKKIPKIIQKTVQKKEYIMDDGLMIVVSSSRTESLSEAISKRAAKIPASGSSKRSAIDNPNLLAYAYSDSLPARKSIAEYCIELDPGNNDEMILLRNLSPKDLNFVKQDNDLIIQTQIEEDGVKEWADKVIVDGYFDPLDSSNRIARIGFLIDGDTEGGCYSLRDFLIKGVGNSKPIGTSKLFVLDDNGTKKALNHSLTSVTMDDTKLNLYYTPYDKNGNTMVSVKEFVNRFGNGATLTWDSAQKRAYIKMDDTTSWIDYDDQKKGNAFDVSINGVQSKMRVMPDLVVSENNNDPTMMVHIETLSKILNFGLAWDSENQTVRVSSTQNTTDYNMPTIQNPTRINGVGVGAIGAPIFVKDGRVIVSNDNDKTDIVNGHSRVQLTELISGLNKTAVEWNENTNTGRVIGNNRTLEYKANFAENKIEWYKITDGSGRTVKEVRGNVNPEELGIRDVNAWVTEKIYKLVEPKNGYGEVNTVTVNYEKNGTYTLSNSNTLADLNGQLPEGLLYNLDGFKGTLYKDHNRWGEVKISTTNYDEERPNETGSIRYTKIVKYNVNGGYDGPVSDTMAENGVTPTWYREFYDGFKGTLFKSPNDRKANDMTDKVLKYDTAYKSITQSDKVYIENSFTVECDDNGNEKPTTVKELDKYYEYEKDGYTGTLMMGPVDGPFIEVLAEKTVKGKKVRSLIRKTFRAYYVGNLSKSYPSLIEENWIADYTGTLTRAGSGPIKQTVTKWTAYYNGTVEKKLDTPIENKVFKMADKTYIGTDLAMELYGLDKKWYEDGKQVELFDSNNGNTSIQMNLANTTRVGTGVRDYINGSEGSDQISGEAGDDVIYGNAGDDLIVGGDGGDNLFGGAGADTIYGGSGNDLVRGDNGNDTLYGNTGDDTLEGYNGDDSIYGGSGNDTLSGGAGNDLLIGEDGNDSLNGGEGNDKLEGGAGNDTYIFENNFGQDVIKDVIGSNTLRFTSKTSQTVEFKRFSDSSDLLITFRGSNDSVLVENYFSNPAMISSIQFSDGVPLSQDMIKARISEVVLTGTDNYIQMNHFGNRYDAGAGDDIVFGTSGNDEILGGEGNDQLYGEMGSDILDGGNGTDELRGSVGSDTYRINSRNNAVTIFEDYQGDGDVDTVDIQYSYKDASFIQSNDDLIIQNKYSKGTATIKNYFSNDEGIEVIKFRNSSGGIDELTREQVFSNVKFGSGYDGSDRVVGTSGDDDLSGFAGDDELIGNQGNDGLNGGIGSDTYVFSKGFGQDVIIESLNMSEFNQIKFTDIRSNEVNVISDIEYGQLRIEVSNSSDSITLMDFYENTGSYIKKITFADGVEWNEATIVSKSRTKTIVGTSGDDVMEGFDNIEIIDVLFGGSGNDTLMGFGGNDILDGGTGKDQLMGGTGSDTYKINDGNNEVLITEDSSVPLDEDTLDIGYAFRMAKITQSGNDLLIQHKTSKGTVRVINYFADDKLMKNIQFTGQGGAKEKLTREQINNLLKFGGTDYDDEIVGTSGADVLKGFSGSDILTGGAGNDVLEGGFGLDTYVFSKGFGQDTIIENYNNGELSKIIFTDFSSSEVTLYNEKDSFDLQIKSTTTSDIVTIKDFYKCPQLIESIQFTDTLCTSSWIKEKTSMRVTRGTSGSERLSGTNSLFISDSMLGEAGDDILIGLGGNDILDGGTGRDQLMGGTGSDTYRINDGNNEVIITEDSSIPQDIDTLDISYAFKLGKITQSGNDLLIQHKISKGTVRVINYFADDKLMKNIQFTGQNGVKERLTRGQIIDIAKYGGTEYDDEIVGTSGNDVLKGLAGNDTLTGGAGNDILEGGLGSDTYVFSKGFGQDTIIETYNSGDIVFTDIYSNEVDIDNPIGTSDLKIISKVTSDSITIRNYYDYEAPIQTISFADDIWEEDTVADNTHYRNIYGSNANEFFSGTDSLLLRDYITAGDGNDSLEGGAGDDYLIGDNGSDSLNGGSGNDRLLGGLGNDEYYFNERNFGNDIISDTEGQDKILLNCINSPEEVFLIRNQSGTALTEYNIDMAVMSSTMKVNGMSVSGALTGHPDNYLYVSNNVTNVNSSVSTSVSTSVSVSTSSNEISSGGAAELRFNPQNQQFSGVPMEFRFKIEVLDEEPNGQGSYEINLRYGNVIVDTIKIDSNYERSNYVNLAANLKSLKSKYGAIRYENFSVILSAKTQNQSELLFRCADAKLIYGGVDTNLSNDLVIKTRNPNEMITVQSYFEGNSNKIEFIRFGSGTKTIAYGDYPSYDAICIKNGLQSTTGNDVLYSTLGGDYLEGGAGNDQYVIRKNSGTDVINDSAGYNTAIIDQTFDQLKFSFKNTDLVISNSQNSDQLIVQSWLSSPSNKLSEIQANGNYYITAQNIEKLIQAMADYSKKSGMSWDSLMYKKIPEAHALLTSYYSHR